MQKTKRSTRASGKIIRCMVKAHIPGEMAAITKESSRIIRFMAMVSTSVWLVRGMKVTGPITKRMAMAYSHGSMVAVSMVNS